MSEEKFPYETDLQINTEELTLIFYVYIYECDISSNLFLLRGCFFELQRLRLGLGLCCLMTPGLSKDIRCHV